MIEALSRLARGPLLLRSDAPGIAQGLVWAEEMASRVVSGNLDAPRTAEAMRHARDSGWKPYDLADGIALIPVRGLILPELGWIGSSYATGCAEIRWQIAEALSDPEVKGIALVIDSGGGLVAGVDETAAAIRAAREAKPIATVVEYWCFSAAYWIGSAAQTVAAPRTGGIGHVGVFKTHFDFSKLLDREGIKPTLIYSGARKVDGNPYEPLGDEARAAMQAAVDAMRRVFAESVAAGRGLPVDAILGTEARVFEGPAAIEEAREAGLIDAILPADEALAAFAAGLTSPQTET